MTPSGRVRPRACSDQGAGCSGPVAVAVGSTHEDLAVLHRAYRGRQSAPVDGCAGAVRASDSHTSSDHVRAPGFWIDRQGPVQATRYAPHSWYSYGEAGPAGWSRRNVAAAPCRGCWRRAPSSSPPRPRGPRGSLGRSERGRHRMTGNQLAAVLIGLESLVADSPGCRGLAAAEGAALLTPASMPHRPLPTIRR